MVSLAKARAIWQNAVAPCPVCEQGGSPFDWDTDYLDDGACGLCQQPMQELDGKDVWMPVYPLYRATTVDPALALLPAALDEIERLRAEMERLRSERDEALYRVHNDDSPIRQRARLDRERITALTEALLEAVEESAETCGSETCLMDCGRRTRVIARLCAVADGQASEEMP